MASVIANLFWNLHTFQPLLTTAEFGEAIAPLEYLEFSTSTTTADFDETGLLLKELIEETFTDGIDKFEGVSVTNRGITGAFYSDDVKYNFKVTRKAVQYKQAATADMQESRRLVVTFSDMVEFAKARKPAAGNNKTAPDKLGRTKNCNPDVSIVCGASCVSKKKEGGCKKPPSDNQKALFDEVIKKAKSANKYSTGKAETPTRAAKSSKTRQRLPKVEAKRPTAGVAAKGRSDVLNELNKRLEGKQSNYRDNIKEQIKEVEEKVTSEKVKSSGKEIKDNRNNESGDQLPDTMKISQTDRKTNDYAEAWKTSWENAPRDLLSVINTYDQPIKVENPTSSTAYYNKGAIHMDDHYAPTKNDSSKAIWRHEYGHYLDDIIPEHLGKKLFIDYLGTKGIDSIDTYERMRSSGRKKDKDKLADVVKGLADSVVSRYGEIDYPMPSKEYYKGLAGAVDDDGRDIFISSTAPAIKAFRDDEKSLLSWHDRVSDQDAHLKAYDELYGTYGGRTTLLSRSTKEKQGIRMRVLKLLDDSKAESRGKANPLLMEKAADMIDDHVKALLGDKPSDFLLASIIIEGITPEVLAAVTEHYLDSIGADSGGIVQDLLGSLTRNKLGFGHSDDYYEEDPIHTQNTETFANIIALYGVGDANVNKTLDKLVPSGFRFVKDTLRKAGN